MEKYSQISITLGALGIVIALIGLFPGIVGLETVEGVGVLQVLVILLGFTILFTGAYLFARQVFYPGMPTTLAQDIGTAPDHDRPADRGGGRAGRCAWLWQSWPHRRRAARCSAGCKRWLLSAGFCSRRPA